MTATMLEGHCRMRVLLPVRFVSDVDAFAVAYGLGSYLALSKQVEVTCGIVLHDAKARRLFPIELQTLDESAEPWATWDIALRHEDALGVMDLSHSLGTHPGRIIAALCWHTIKCLLDADGFAIAQGVSRETALDALFPGSLS